MFIFYILLSTQLLLVNVSSECRIKQEKYISGNNKDAVAALKFLKENDILQEKWKNKLANAEWNYQSNLTEYNKYKYLQVVNELAKFNKESWKNSTLFDWKIFKTKNETIYRWFKSLSSFGPATMSTEKFTEMNNIITEMQNVYSKTKVCKYESPNSEPCSLSLEPELVEIMKTSTDYYELMHIWSQWHNKTGRKLKTDFLRYVDLYNEASCANGFSNAKEFWLEEFESKNFIKQLENLWENIKPFYEQLHAFVRRKLINIYTTDLIKEDGPIPAHLLGNMWSQSWENIYNLIAPYSKNKTIDVTDTMKQKNMTVKDMFKISEEFFISLGLKKMTQTFWNRSIFEKPKDREMICHPSAWNFYNDGDARIKMCTRINMENLIVIHHEMGHIEYYLQYEKQPVVFRKGANSGFNEAIGDVLALSVATPNHMKKIGLLQNVTDDPETEINNLLKTALRKITLVPFSFIIDTWRWKMSDGTISKSESNTHWWNLRLKYQGVCPPVLRTEEDLDPLAKYHVIANIPYIRYFISTIIQFQFHKALCNEAKHRGPLHKCDIYQNKKAGKLLRTMLQLGSSVSWRDAMKVITKGHTDKMDEKPILEYFKPLYDWLKEQNKNEYIGWKNNNSMICP